MPVIQIYRERLERLVPGHTYEEIIKVLPYIGVDIEEQTNDYVRIEYSPNRPDFGTDYMVARALRGILGDELGIRKWSPEKGDISVFVDKSVESVRPFIAVFAARGLSLDDESIRQLISLQEDLHQGVGRGRKKVAIGLHDLSPVRFPLTYRATGPEHRFIPLNSDREMTIKEMLESTEQGRKYGSLLNSWNPVILDSSGMTLSVPPIINGNYTRLTVNTRNMLVDITGTDERAVKLAASVLAETLHEMGSTIVEGVTIYPDKRTIVSPDVSEKTVRVSLSMVSSLLGLSLSPDKAIEAIKRSGLDAIYDNGDLLVTVPHYRGDILHPVDIAEEVLIGYGLFNVEPDLNISFSKGGLMRETRLLELVKSTAIGMGFTEVLNPMLVSDELLRMFSVQDNVVMTEFSKSSEHNALRTALFPGCVKVISINQNETMPRRMFETGDVVFLKDGAPVQQRRLCLIEERDKASLTEAKSYFDAILRVMALDPTKASYVPIKRNYALRAFEIRYSEKEAGETFEVNPELLEKLKIKNPVIVLEIYLDVLQSFVLA